MEAGTNCQGANFDIKYCMKHRCICDDYRRFRDGKRTKEIREAKQ